MSHGKIRTEKICLNCGTETTGRYCPACGQENIEPKQSVWHLIHHFFSDITHFDGKFFVTVKDLFAKPGFLSREYMIGRRASYLDPIRMYIFTSAIFFLIFFSIFNVKNMHFGDDGIRNEVKKVGNEVKKGNTLNEALSHADNKEDSLEIIKAFKAAAPYVKITDSLQNKGDLNVTLDSSDYTSIEAYDSVQKSLPLNQRHNWLTNKINKRKIELTIRYQKEHENLIRELINDNVHNWPKVLFISLPLFALILKLLYIRRKQFYYVDHGIFSIHLYIFSFLILLVLFGLNALSKTTGWKSGIDWLILAAILYPFFYYYKAMRRFYGQRRAKTVFKYILLLILSFFVYLIIFLGAILFTVFEA